MSVVVGIPADRRIVDPHPFHMVGEKYVTAIRDGSAALPFILPVLGDSIDMDAVLEKVDGIFLTGSPSNVEPHHYGGNTSRDGTMHDADRDTTTLPLITRVLDRGIPLLAVCRGFQEINVALGGTLHQHVHEEPGYHLHKENPEDPLDIQYGSSHEVHLVEGGLLRQMTGETTVTVNSLHSQAIARIADALTVEAVADDGLVEGVRADDVPGFNLAVQWHPEWQVTQNPFSMAIFRAFGDACRAYAATRRA